MRTIATLFAAGFLLLSGTAAAETAPDALLTRISNEVLEDLRRNPKDPARAATLIETKLLPHFDAHRATRLAVGVHWRQASPGQQESLVREFTALLVRTYQSGAEPVAIEYDLARHGGAWKVFDVRVAGISLVATYRSAFAEHARNHGIEGLLELLQSRNRKLQSALRM